MVDPMWTRLNETPNKSIRQDVPRKGVVLHHAALTSLDYLRELEMGAKEVSSSAIVKDDNREQMFSSDAYRAWSLSDGYWDSALRSVETCNESTVGWTVSDASHRSLGRLVAFWAVRDGFYPHRDGDPTTWTVIGHREVYTIHGGSYGTACPGGMDLDLVTKYAQEIYKGLLSSGMGMDDMAGVIIVRNVGTNSKWAGNVIALSPKRARNYVGSGDKGAANIAARRLGQSKNTDGTYFVDVSNDVELTMVAHSHGIGNAALDWLDAQPATAEIDVQRDEIVAAIKAALVGGVTATANVNEESIAEKVANEQDRRAAKRLTTVVDA